MHNYVNQETLLSIVKKRKIQWFGHINRHHNSLSLANTVIYWRVLGWGILRENLLSNISELTNLSVIGATTRNAAERKTWECMVENKLVHLYGPWWWWCRVVKLIAHPQQQLNSRLLYYWYYCFRLLLLYDNYITSISVAKKITRKLGMFHD